VDIKDGAGSTDLPAQLPAGSEVSLDEYSGG